MAVNLTGLPMGSYPNILAFKNKGKGGDWFSNIMDAISGGTTYVPILLTVSAPSLLTPVMAEPTLATNGNGDTLSTQVDLSWNYPDAATLNYVKGYRLYSTTTPGRRVLLAADCHPCRMLPPHPTGLPALLP